MSQSSQDSSHKLNNTSPENTELVKYVRVRSDENARFVEFDFAINDPSLFVELVMPHKVFQTFCVENSVIFMSDEQSASVDAEMERWRYGADTLMSHNHDRCDE